MAANASVPEKISYLREHLQYERDMLRYAYEKLFSAEKGCEWNAAFECFGLHARNLYDFLRHEGKKSNTYRADSFARNHQKPMHLEIFNSLDVFQFHLAFRRMNSDKLTMIDLEKMVEWIDREWEQWVNAVEGEFVLYLDKQPIKVQLPFSNGMSEASACTAINTVSYSSESS